MSKKYNHDINNSYSSTKKVYSHTDCANENIFNCLKKEKSSVGKSWLYFVKQRQVGLWSITKNALFKQLLAVF